MRASQRLQCLCWIANAMYGAVKIEATRRLDQELQQLLRTLSVAPIADPDNIVPGFLDVLWPEQSGVGGFVPSKGAAAPTQPFISGAEYFPEGQDRVIVPEWQCRDGSLIRDAAMM